MIEHGRSQVRPVQFEDVVSKAQAPRLRRVKESVTTIEARRNASPRALSKCDDVAIIEHRPEWRSGMPGFRRAAATFQYSGGGRARAGFRRQDILQSPRGDQFLPESACIGRPSVRSLAITILRAISSRLRAAPAALNCRWRMARAYRR